MTNLIGISGKIGAGKNTVAHIIQYLMVMFRPQGSTWQYEGLLHQLEDSSASYSLDAYGCEQKAFATKLKELAAMLLGVQVAKLNDRDFKASKLPAEWKRYCMREGNKKIYFNTLEEAHELFQIAENGNLYIGEGYEEMTVREFLQLIGTDLFREQLHPNVWVNALFADYKPHPRRCELSNPSDKEGYYTVPSLREIPERIWGMKVQSRIIEWQEFPSWIITDVRFPNEAKAIKDRGGIIVRVERPMSTRTKGYHDHLSETALDNWNFDHVIENNQRFEELINKVELFLERFEIIKP